MTDATSRSSLPPYEPAFPIPSSTPSTPVASTSSAFSSTVNARVDSTVFYGGSGVRLPLDKNEREREELRSLSQLGSFGVQQWLRGFDEVHSWDPCECYKSAAQQLDVLLPLLSTSEQHLLKLASLRTVTVRLPTLPTADLGHLVTREGRDEISRALKTWLSKPSVEPHSIWVFAELVARRIRSEGFSIVEEWWDFSGGFAQFVVRC